LTESRLAYNVFTIQRLAEVTVNRANISRVRGLEY